MTVDRPAGADKLWTDEQRALEESHEGLVWYNAVMTTVMMATVALCVIVTAEGTLGDMDGGDVFCELDSTLTCRDYKVRCVGEGFVHCDSAQMRHESASIVLDVMSAELIAAEEFPDLIPYLQALVRTGAEVNQSAKATDTNEDFELSAESVGGSDSNHPVKTPANRGVSSGGFDLSQPAKPQMKVGSSAGGFDLSQPAKPRMKSGASSGGFDLGQPAKPQATGVASAGGFDLSQPAKPQMKSEPSAGGFDLSQPAKAQMKADTSAGGFDLSQPAKPQSKAGASPGGFDLSQPAKSQETGVASAGGFDLSQPAKPQMKPLPSSGGFDLSQPAKPQMKGAASADGFDLSQPAKPQMKAGLSAGGFDLSQPAKPQIKPGPSAGGFDLSQPAKPQMKPGPSAGGFDLSQPAKSQTKAEASSGGFDLSQPAKPRTKAEASSGGFDLSQPAKPQMKGGLSTGGFDLSQPAVVRSSRQGFDLSQPAKPKIMNASSPKLTAPHVPNKSLAMEKNSSLSSNDSRGGANNQKLLEQMNRLRRYLNDNRNETDVPGVSAPIALDMLEADLQRPANVTGDSCTIARMVCTEMSPLSSCQSAFAKRCHAKKKQISKQGMLIGLLVPITITTIGVLVFVLFWKRIGSQVDVEQPSAERAAGAAKKCDAGGSQPAA